MFLKISQFFLQHDLLLWKQQMQPVHQELLPAVKAMEEKRRQRMAAVEELKNNTKTMMTMMDFVKILFKTISYAIYRFSLFAMFYFLVYIAPVLLYIGLVLFFHALKFMVRRSMKNKPVDKMEKEADGILLWDQFTSMKANQLRNQCHDHGLKTSRYREDMVRSLVAYNTAVQHCKSEKPKP